MELPNTSDIMVTELLTLRPETDIFEAIECLLARQFSGAPVVDADGALVGMLTERDCLRLLSHWAVQGPPGGTVADYMRVDVETVAPELDLMGLASLFQSRDLRRFAVCDANGNLVGQVSCRDALREIQKMGRLPSPYPDYRRPQQ